YETAIALIPPYMRTFWRYHRVEYGESLSAIAHKYHTSTGVIEEANDLSSDEVIVGSKLIIPIAPGATGDSVAYSRKATRYQVRKGDTVGSIADDFEVPVDKLRKWNHLKGNTVAVGRTLLIYKPLAGSGGPEVASTGDDPPPPKSGTKGKTAKTAKSGSKPASGSQTA